MRRRRCVRSTHVCKKLGFIRINFFFFSDCHLYIYCSCENRVERDILQNTYIPDVLINSLKWLIRGNVRETGLAYISENKLPLHFASRCWKAASICNKKFLRAHAKFSITFAWAFTRIFIFPRARLLFLSRKRIRSHSRARALAVFACAEHFA